MTFGEKNERSMHSRKAAAAGDRCRLAGAERDAGGGNVRDGKACGAPVGAKAEAAGTTSNFGVVEVRIALEGGKFEALGRLSAMVVTLAGDGKREGGSGKAIGAGWLEGAGWVVEAMEASM